MPNFLTLLEHEDGGFTTLRIVVITYHLYELTYQNILIFGRTAATYFAVGRTPWSKIGSLHDE